MRCPWAIQTIMLYCAGTDQSCKLDEVNHFHLFRVSNNVISFNVKQGQHYELFVPADKDSQGLWHNEGIVPYEQAPDFRDRIDPLALIGFHTLGVFTAASNVTTASLRRLAGGNRIGICRIDPPSSIQGTAWLALPFSRSSATIWNQPLHDTPNLPLPWITCFVAMLFLQWANDTSKARPSKDMLHTLLQASLFTDAILWASLSIVILGESTIEDSSYGQSTLGACVGLFVLATIVPSIHKYSTWWTDIVLGFVTLFTSGFYITTTLLWAHTILKIMPKQVKPSFKQYIGNLIF